mmetsp:Transcript_27146/g.56872  ORF Transcript_27146/g.56872 Transcript_27146/m.56872 type:complete len:164 (+) Transcript_27146:330-821(+)
MPTMRKLKAAAEDFSLTLDEKPDLKAKLEELSKKVQKPSVDDMMKHDDIRDMVEKMTVKFDKSLVFDTDEVEKLRELYDGKIAQVDNTAVFQEIDALAPEMKEIRSMTGKIRELQKTQKPCYYMQEDYFECLHGAKRARRDIMVFQREQELKELAKQGNAGGH